MFLEPQHFPSHTPSRYTLTLPSRSVSIVHRSCTLVASVCNKRRHASFRMAYWPLAHMPRILERCVACILRYSDLVGSPMVSLTSRFPLKLSNRVSIVICLGLTFVSPQGAILHLYFCLSL
jgi:hypothetical protein